MNQTEKLGLWLPEDSDPLEVSKLSENFEALDDFAKEVGGGDVSALVKNMKVGDITYSARNLEEESGGALIACDQRTIDTDAYPDIPEKILYWPYPAVVSENWIGPTSPGSPNTEYPTIYGVPFLNTEKYKYIPMRSGSGSSAFDAIEIYDEDADTLDYVDRYGSVSKANFTGCSFLRLSDDRILIMGTTGNIGSSGGKVAYFHNDLRSVELQNSASNATIYLGGTASTVYKLENGRILMLTFQTNATNVNTGVRYTDDDFATIMSSSVPAEMLTDIGRRANMVGDNGARAYYDIYNTFHPAVIDGQEIYILCYPKDAQADLSITAANLNTGLTAENVENVFPVTYYSGDNGTVFLKRPLPDNCMEVLKPFFEASKAVNRAISYGVGKSPLTVRVGHHLYMRYMSGTCYYNDAPIYEHQRYMYIDLNLKTNHIDNISEVLPTAASYRVPEPEYFFSNSNVDKFVYVEKDHAIYLFKNYDISRFDLETFQCKTVSDLIFPGTSTNGALQIGPTHYIVTNINAEDVRLAQRGAGGPANYGVRIIDSANFIPGVSDRRSTTVFSMDSITTKNSSGGPALTGSLVSAALSEYDGDIYTIRDKALYKIAKNHRQMPYIPNAYMKVLDESVEEVSE